MTEPNLAEKHEKTRVQVVELTSQLDQQDPIRSWCQIELETLLSNSTDGCETLEETNSRLSALKQLLFVIRKHAFNLKHPGSNNEKGYEDSFLTVQARLPSNVLQSARELRFTISPELLHDPLMQEEHDPVSPTAKIVAALRSLDPALQLGSTDSLVQEGHRLLSAAGELSPMEMASMAVLFQSRYHAINAAISAGESEAQILEFAAGVSPRGYQWAQMSPGTIYVESDLPKLMIHKAKQLRNFYLAGNAKARGILHCCGANVLDSASVFSAIENLDTNSPFTMVTEGLLLYFNQSEMKRFFEIMSSVLKRFPKAVWVSDIVSRADLKRLLDFDPALANTVRNIFANTQREVVPSNPFESEHCIREMLDRFGIHVVDTVLLADATTISEPEISTPLPDRKKIVGNRKIWRMSSKGN